MTPLTYAQQIDYVNETVCGECGEKFRLGNHQVRHHDHVSCQYLFPTCSNCNLAPTIPNRKLKVTQGHNGNVNKKDKFYQDWEEEKYVKNFFLPVIFHKLRSCDAQCVIKHFKK